MLRSGEDRFGVRVVGAGFADLYLSVAAPPATLEEAIHLAAEHFAFCPGDIWQNSHPHTLIGYAENLVGAPGLHSSMSRQQPSSSMRQSMPQPGTVWTAA